MFRTGGFRQQVVEMLRRGRIVLGVSLVVLLLALPQSAFAVPHSVIHGIPDGVSTTDVTFWIEIADFDMGCEGIFHILGPGGGVVVNDGETVPVGASTTVSSEGTTVVTYWVDNGCCGATDGRKTAIIRIHKTPPGPDTFPPATYADAHFSYISSATITLSSADRGLGSAATYYILDGGPQTPYSVPLSLLTEGAHSIEFWSVDFAGNMETHQRTEFAIVAPAAPDVTPPVTSSDILGSYTGTATIDIDANDNIGGSGVAVTYYRLDGAVGAIGLPHTDHPAVVTVTTLGSHTIEFWSEDWASNAEGHHNASFTIIAKSAGSTDTTAPRTVSNAQAVYEGPASIALTASDAGSGVTATWYRLDGGSQVRYTTPIGVATLGPHTLEFWSVDVAGNTETPHNTVLFTVDPIPVGDTTPPSTSSDAVLTYTGPASIHLTAGDSGGSGVAHTYYSLDRGSQQTGTSISVSALGSHILEFWSVDGAGNVETPHGSVTFTVSAPTPTPAPTPAPKATTRITIDKSTSPARVRRSFSLSGVLTPGERNYRVRVEVRKPGSSVWSYVSLRSTFATTAAGGAKWSCSYTPKSKGTYRFRARFTGNSTSKPSTSRTISVAVR